MACHKRHTVCAVLRGLLALLLLLSLPARLRADVQFDGVDDALRQGLPRSTFVTATNLTISAVVFVSGPAPGGAACWEAGPLVTDEGGHLALGRQDDGAGDRACAFLYDGTTRLSQTPLTPGWHHLSLTVQGGTVTLRVNGVPGTPDPTGGIADLTYVLALGGNVTLGGGWSPDRLAEVRVYNTVVDVTPYARSRLRLHPPGTPTGYWPLEDCAEGAGGGGVTFRDRSGNNRHMTGAIGPNGTGLTCKASSGLSRPMPIQ